MATEKSYWIVWIAPNQKYYIRCSFFSNSVTSTFIWESYKIFYLEWGWIIKEKKMVSLNGSLRWSWEGWGIIINVW